MDWNTDRRRDVRLQGDDSLRVQVLAATALPGLVGEILQCSSLDVSASGLKLTVPVNVPLHCKVDLWIDIKACACTFFLNGQVKWCDANRAREDIYQIGVQLRDAPFTDFENWRDLFAVKDTFRTI